MSLNIFNLFEAAGRRIMELRLSERRKIIGLVEVLQLDGTVSMKGSIFNISDTGMMIGTTLDYRFPASFLVRLGSSGDPRAAELVWHRTGLAGLKLKG